MADERVVSTKLEQIEQYHGELKEKQQTLSRDEFLRDTTEQRAVERMFENAIRASSDLAQHVATQDEVYETLQTGLAVYDSYSRQVAQWFRDDE
ncbi:HepT-like ribonuclease domain-containing protein [Halosimplex halophilum]|uniref:HepT-like ribonuclease domain-containing protein n=1 Tax=Halosimplex halophilum TaxID=2559572 RepID=UPI00107F4F3F|nr:HepT-like ribonuclease domain-containing protein [Halosimplex halophilum]